MSSAHIPNILLNDGNSIPQYGLGTWELTPDVTYTAVRDAIEQGIRHFDTAMIYFNEAAVGRAVRDSGIDRSELFITTKLWNADQGKPQEAFQTSLRELGLDYVDLYLIHWPVPQADLFTSAWEQLIAIRESQRSRSIGVSNFRSQDIQTIIDATGVAPVLNQIELHPYFSQVELRAANDQHNVKTESWSPLGRGELDDPVLKAIAAEVGKDVAQVILRWHVQSDIIVFPRSSKVERNRTNAQIFDFQLTEDQMARINALERDGRNGPTPEQVGLNG